jgi:hypothetical protein
VSVESEESEESEKPCLLDAFRQAARLTKQILTFSIHLAGQAGEK